MREEEAPVGRNAIPRLQEHHVTWHELVRGQLAHLPVAPRASAKRHHPLEGRERLLGPVLLHESEHGVEDGDRRHHDGVLQIADRPGHDGRCAEEQSQEPLQLREEKADEGAGRLVRQTVGSDVSQPPRGLLGAEPPRLSAESREHILEGQRPHGRQVRAECFPLRLRRTVFAGCLHPATRSARRLP